MSRRKQPNPRHLESEQALASSLLHNDELLDSQSDDEGGGDEHICGRCRAEFVELTDFLRHKKQCARKRIVVVFSDDCGSGEAGSDQEDLVSFNSSSYFRDLEYNGDLMNKRNEDLENNNSVVSAFDKDFDNKGGLADDSLDILDNGEKELLQFTRPLQSHLTSTPANLPHLSLPMAGLTGPSLPDSNVSLEALRNTKVAVAQYPSNIMPPPTNDVVVLQSTLYSLQQQQLLQLQLIQQIQLQIGAQKNNSSNAGSNITGGVTSSTYSHSQPLSLSTGGSSTTPPITTSSSAIVQPPPNELNQPNSLELLQRSAQQVLNNASQGLLANGLDFSKGKSSSMGSYDHKSGLGRSGSTEPFFKHRCRFCGKVFGSDSALQIHIRSHTGERPFKCNVCGNRFSTRGNLKVHFQRHKAKYPHIRMNPNPVPEHLDRFHPPLIPSEVAAAAAHRQGGHPSDLMASGCSSPPLSYPSSLAHLPAIPQSPIPTHSPTPTPLDLGPPKSQSATPNTILPPTSSSSSSTNHELAPTPPRVTESPASLVNKPPSPGAGSEDSHENSLERSLSPVGSMRSEDRDKSLSPVPHGDESSKESLMGSKADSDTPTPDIGAAKHTSPSAVPSPTIMMSRGGPHNQHNHLSSPVTSFSSLLPMSTSSIPTTFSMTHSLSTLSAAGSLHTSTLPLTDPALDPAVYTPLLPKPGSNDNSWESLIEITKTSETSKLQQLVDNIEHKLSDPNQCVICHRVLSCKSALQMHYRTHTGERPFKCKICGRAFTTKGNLKTHMGVHRAKPPVRVLHQCPVCHKKFTNALVLQQHIRMHTGEPTDLSLEQIQAAEVKDYPPTLHPSLPHLMSPPGSGTPPQMGSSPVTLMPSAMMKPSPLPAPNASTSGSGSDLRTPESESVIKSSSSVSEGEKSNDGDSFPTMKADNGNGSMGPVHSVPTSAIVPTFSTSLAALENHVKAINTTIAHHVSAYNALMATSGGGSSMTMHEDSSSPTPTEDSIMNGDKSPEPLSSPIPGMHQGDQSSPDDRSTPSIKVESPSPGITASTASHALSTTPSPASVISMVNSECGNLPGTPLDLTPKASVITSLPSESSGIPTSFAGLPIPPHILQPGNRISTTCNICFKTFACNSALEIHYRSHTKIRPFRCTSCDRSFSTKGNMKQHMLTHKIRDLPPQLFDSKMVTSPHQNVGTENLTTNSSSTSSPSVSNTDAGVKRPMVEGDSFIPIPKRPPGLPKHLCHVCNKNFSSASALQIHMRTHTGDKPFKCTICERAFTTKGNLKVHMGTHMWNNGTSRRGRRMSIDLPPIPLGAKDSEFIQRRPDLYFPFMAAPFMNGLAATKVNEISVIQSATMNNGGLSSPPMGIAPTGNMSCGNIGNSMSSPIGGGGSAPAAGSGGGGGNSGGGGGGNGVIGGMVSNSMGMMTGEMGSGMRSNIPTPTPTPTSTPTPTPPDLDLSMKKPPLMTTEDTPPPQLPPMVAPPMNVVSKPSPSPASPNEDQPTDMSKTASWVWKLACNLCSKVCTSSSELEIHLQAHYKAEVKEGLSSPHSDNLAV